MGGRELPMRIVASLKDAENYYGVRFKWWTAGCAGSGSCYKIHCYKIIATDASCFPVPMAQSQLSASIPGQQTSRFKGQHSQVLIRSKTWDIKTIYLPPALPPVTQGDNVVGKQADTEWEIAHRIRILNYACTSDGNKVILCLHDSADSRQRFTCEQI
ncbi:hypothetical protein OG21DRAFT_1548216 [Imleria badia]|nr:hypothetical protein OG21DRAFT_1548216 [Imleria badia]